MPPLQFNLLINKTIIGYFEGTTPDAPAVCNQQSKLNRYFIREKKKEKVRPAGITYLVCSIKTD